MFRKLLLITLMPFLVAAQDHSDLVLQTVVGSAMGLFQGAGKGLADPIKDLVLSVTSPFLHPLETLKSAQRLTFVSRHTDSFNFEELVQYQQAIHNSINANLIDRANASNKALRQALIAGSKDKDDALQDNDCLFAVSIVKAQLENFAGRLELARSVYEQELFGKEHTGKAVIGGAAVGAIAGAVYNYTVSPHATETVDLKTIKLSTTTWEENVKSRTFMGLLTGITVGYVGSKLMNSPYSRQELQQIVFMIGQIQDHVLYMISMIDGLKDLSQITDKKDAITMVLKSLTSEIAQLAFAIDSSRAFDPKYKGLKLMYDASKLVDRGPKPVAE